MKKTFDSLDLIRLRSCVLIEKNRQILLVFDPIYRGGCWTLPGGGEDFNETVIKAAERETFEETGVRIKIHEIIRIREIWEPELDYPQKKNPIRKTLEIIFTGNFISGEIDFQHNPSNKPDGLSRVSDCRWISITELFETYEGFPVYPDEIKSLLEQNKRIGISVNDIFLNPLDLRK